MKKPYQPTFLYIKIHNTTGLKYFGKTIRKDPYKYKGSGTYWMRHIEEHGYDVTTIVLNEGRPYDDEMTMKLAAKTFSEENNIVHIRDESGRKIWANLIPEMGEGAIQSENPKWIKSNQEYMRSDNNPAKKYGGSCKGKKRPGIGGRKKGFKWTEKDREAQQRARATEEFKAKKKAYWTPERRKESSERQKGKNGHSKNKPWYNNGLEERQMNEPPDGWTKGRLNVNRNRKQLKLHWYNNGEISKQFSEGTEEKGYVRGRLPYKK